MASHWVFGYGSLMWNPGFRFVRREPASLDGYRRELCVYSFHYRGTPAQMGLVFGLAAKGQCQGVAFEVADEDWDETLNYLREREQITMVYEELIVPVVLTKNQEAVMALTYVVDPTHEQCALGLTDASILQHVREACGSAGTCLDYVRNTHKHLNELGIVDKRLATIVARLPQN